MQRNPDYLYRVTRRADGRWSLTSYLEGATDTTGPSAMFTDEALPDWVRKDVALLSMVDEMGEIKSIGHRIGDAFWLVSENSKKLLRRRKVIIDMAADQMNEFYKADPTTGEFFGEIK